MSREYPIPLAVVSYHIRRCCGRYELDNGQARTVVKIAKYFETDNFWRIDGVCVPGILVIDLVCVADDYRLFGIADYHRLVVAAITIADIVHVEKLCILYLLENMSVLNWRILLGYG